MTVMDSFTVVVSGSRSIVVARISQLVSKLDMVDNGVNADFP